jgi:hypothetical protein
MKTKTSVTPVVFGAYCVLLVERFFFLEFVLVVLNIFWWCLFFGGMGVMAARCKARAHVHLAQVFEVSAATA